MFLVTPPRTLDFLRPRANQLAFQYQLSLSVAIDCGEFEHVRLLLLLRQEQAIDQTQIQFLP
jgi:hypothetical protein